MKIVEITLADLLKNTDAKTGEPLGDVAYALNEDQARAGQIFASVENLESYFGIEKPKTSRKRKKADDDGTDGEGESGDETENSEEA